LKLDRKEGKKYSTVNFKKLKEKRK